MFRFIFGTWIGRLLMFLAAVGAAVWGVRRFLGLDQAESDDWTPAPEEPPAETSAGSTDVDASLLEILACPEDKQPIVKMDDKIVCTALWEALSHPRRHSGHADRRGRGRSGPDGSRGRGSTSGAAR